MTSTLQNRLVGTIIVVALVVILVPEFLDGEKRTNKQEFVNIPIVSDIVQVENTKTFDTSNVDLQMKETVELVDEQAVDAELDDVTEENAKLAAGKSAKPKTAQNVNPNATQDAAVKSAQYNTPPVASANPTSPKEQIVDDLAEIKIKDSGWVVQLGSFKHEKNVKVLLNTLNAAGYRAYSRPVMTSVGELTKVFVGPELDKEKLELALPHLKEITQLKGKITAFEVSAG